MHDPQQMLTQQGATERIAQLQHELDVLRQELEHSQRLATLGFLAAGTAHEINNVLTPVLAYAQLAASNPADQEFQAKAMQKIAAGAQTASQIAQSMLGFAGRPDEDAVADVRDTLDLALECTGRDPRKDKIKLLIDIAPGTIVKMRPLALQQVMMNIILNARSALQPRGGTISVSANQPKGDRLELVFADNGPGISSLVQSRLFEPFVTDSNRGDAKSSSKRRKAAGSGLGLAICKRLVEEAGGNIAVASTPGAGTTFTVAIPMAQVLRAIA